MTFDEVFEKFETMKDRESGNSMSFEYQAEMLRLALLAIASLPAESIWMDDRDACADMMIKLAQLALKKI